MELIQAKQIIDRIDEFVDIINTTIGVINAKREFCGDNEIKITMKLGKGISEVGYFILNHITQNIVNRTEAGFICYLMSGWILIQYKLGEDFINTNNRIVNELINIVYEAIDAAKVEYCFTVEPVLNRDLPMQIMWEIDTWNENCEDDEEVDRFIEYDNIYQYKLPKKALYSISLGYHSINLDLLESDLCPELIGILFESVEDFCYVTTFEDEDYIYFYSAVEFTEDTIFDIEEGLINVLSIISDDEPEETLEDVWNRI